MASADAQMTPVTDDDHHAALTFICVTVPLLALALATLIARISIKLRRALRLGWDDHFLVVGCVRGTTYYFTITI